MSETYNQKKQVHTVSAVASFLRLHLPLELQKSFDFYQLDSDYTALPNIESEDMRYLHGLVSRIIHRGTGTLPGIEVERYIASSFGNGSGLKENSDGPGPPVEWNLEPELESKISQFADLLSPWVGELDRIPLDPTNPQNERRLLKQLAESFGPRFISCLYTQVYLSEILPAEKKDDFLAQRLDFLIAFPNGRCFVLEPGDHEDGPNPLTQKSLDKERDLALQRIGIPTLRFRNNRIGTPQLTEDIKGLVHKCDGERFLKDLDTQQRAEDLKLSHLIQLPTLIARIEDVLTTIFLQRGLLGEKSFSLCVLEQDLECAEIALYSFMERLHRLANFNRIDLPEPKIKLTVVRTGKYACTNWSKVREKLKGFGCMVEEIDKPSTSTFDLSIDVAVKANYLTLASPVASTGQAVIRNVYPHSEKHHFSYSSQPRELLLEDERDQILAETFLADFFRKKNFREGQFPIIKNMLAQKATIGLLPTSAGKSFCYQFSSLLTPGITLVVDPLNFLMNDQALGLIEDHGITAIDVWHSGKGALQAEQVGEMMGTNLIIFLSPERFLRDKFRDAMRQLTAADLFVNYAVIDEAHCVSMWGHDFRPPYLMLRRLFRAYCTFGGREPVVVALTGTASQLVLIDLKRQLDIEEMESIIRPNSFDRPELTYNIVSCRTQEKKQTLSSVFRSIENRLGIQNIKHETNGIVFANLPKEVWELYGAQAGDADAHVMETASNQWESREITTGMACGGKPKNSPVSSDAWELYKNKILAQFKRGKVKMLIGNAAIGVGIDSKHVRYSVVCCMPGSLESLVQQWGRAGRTQKKSECYLIYSDDNKKATDQWLDGELEKMPRRYDDLGTIAYFYESQFPGEKIEQDGVRKVGNVLLGKNNVPDDDGRRIIAEDGSEKIPRYLSFLIMLGVVEDYEVSGAYKNTKYRVQLTNDFEEAHDRNDREAIDEIYVKSLKSYLSRYRPTTEQDIRDRVQQRPENKFGPKCLGYLISFIYSEIGYQRKESIRTMVSFCREANQSPESIRLRVKGYLDRDPKFSDRLEEMSEGVESINPVIEAIKLIEGYDDVEHLYWETRRLLGERLRADWLALNLYSVLYRERTVSKNTRISYQQFIGAVEAPLSPEEAVNFLVGFFDCVYALDKVLNEAISEAILLKFMAELHSHSQILCLQVLEDISMPEEVKILFRGMIATKQMGGLLNECKRKHGLS